MFAGIAPTRLHFITKVALSLRSIKDTVHLCESETSGAATAAEESLIIVIKVNYAGTHNSK